MLARRDLTSTRATKRDGPPVPVGLYVPTYKRAAYEAIRDMIIELELPPGARLVESELASRLLVSKTPIREAIGLLEADGLVEVAPYRGATVRWLSTSEMDEQRFLIDALEVPAFPRVVERITNAELAAVGRVVQQLKRARVAHDGRRFRQLTTEYHQLLFAPADFPRLVRCMTMLVFPIGLRMDRVFLDNFDDTWDAQLSLMVARYEGIKRRDPNHAAEAVLSIRERVHSLNVSRLSHPLVAPYFKST
jgi:DNA-binding GntR family transcriptional regulator